MGLGLLHEDLSRCIPMLLWKSARSILSSSSTSEGKRRALHSIQSLPLTTSRNLPHSLRLNINQKSEQISRLILRNSSWEAIKAVFRSWNNPRAIYYRRMNDIPGSWGTAVNVQAMVFGNMGDTSEQALRYKKPGNRRKKLFGEFLMNAQGEDVVAGVRTPQPIDQLKEVSEEAYNQFVISAPLLKTLP